MSEREQKSIVMIPFIILVILVTLLSSCSTTKQGGGCGRSPIHLGN